jgi:hypothetical protein
VEWRKTGYYDEDIEFFPGERRSLWGLTVSPASATDLGNSAPEAVHRNRHHDCPPGTSPYCNSRPCATLRLTSVTQLEHCTGSVFVVGEEHIL